MTGLAIGLAAFFALATAVLAWRLRRVSRQGAAPSSASPSAASHAGSSEPPQDPVALERERIYNDLHDDLGAKLLTLIYQSKDPVQADLARAILQDLRDVVTRSRGTPGTLGDVLADLRSEATQRLAAVGIGLAWDEADDLPDPPLDTARALHLHRIVREAISNVIRHAQAQRLRVRVRASGNELRLELTDDGSGAAVGNPHPGTGMRNMRERAAELAGDIAWTPGTEGGTKVLLAMPLA